MKEYVIIAIVDDYPVIIGIKVKLKKIKNKAYPDNLKNIFAYTVEFTLKILPNGKTIASANQNE